MLMESEGQWTYGLNHIYQIKAVCWSKLWGKYQEDIRKITYGVKEIKHAVPPGSVLCPILLYTNDLPINTEGAETVLFAIGTNILIQVANEYILCHEINRVTRDLIIWLHANELVINTEKPTAMTFHTWQNKRFLKPQIRFNDTDVTCK